MHKSHGPIGNLIPNTPIHIIGAGISGLIMGYFLHKQGTPFTIYEKKSFIGGKIGTNLDKFGIAEKAANAIFSNDDVFELLEDLNIAYYEADRKLKKFVWRKGYPHSPPIKKSEVLKILLSLFKKTPIQDNLSVRDFFMPLLGSELCDEILAPALGGIYAKDIDELHFQSIFKDIDFQNSYLSFLLGIKNKKKSQKSRATSISFDGGMQGLINKLEKLLAVYIKTDCDMKDLPKENVIICTDALEASELLKNNHPNISTELNKIQYTKVSTATLITEKQITFLNSSFGILFPPASKEFNSLGILSNSEIFPGRTKDPKHHSYTFIVKGNDDIEKKIKQDLNCLNQELSFSSKKSIQIKTWNRGIPVYNLERYNSIFKIRSDFTGIAPGTVLFGNYIDGISIRELITMAKSFTSNS